MTPARRSAPAVVLALGASLTLIACGSEIIIHDIGEKEANEIVVLLSEYDIVTSKTMRDTGREILYSIAVKPGARVQAMKVLNEHDYPRRKIGGYDKVYAEGGLIPTSSEEKAKKIQAIEGEIERQLTLVPGVLDAQVNLVIPEESALRTNEETQVPTTASVAVKYIPSKGGGKPLQEPEVRAIVAAGVEKLRADNVVVVMTQASTSQRADAECRESTGKGPLGRFPDRTQKLIIAAALITVVVLLMVIGFWQIRLRNVRGRLIRLQNEIAKARRRGPEAVAE